MNQGNFGINCLIVHIDLKGVKNVERNLIGTNGIMNCRSGKMKKGEI